MNQKLRTAGQKRKIQCRNQTESLESDYLGFQTVSKQIWVGYVKTPIQGEVPCTKK